MSDAAITAVSGVPDMFGGTRAEAKHEGTLPWTIYARLRWPDCSQDLLSHAEICRRARSVPCPPCVATIGAGVFRPPVAAEIIAQLFCFDGRLRAVRGQSPAHIGIFACVGLRQRRKRERYAEAAEAEEA